MMACCLTCGTSRRLLDLRLPTRARLGEKLAMLTPGGVQFRPPLGELRHGITFRSIHVRVHPVKVSGQLAASSVRWFPLARLARAAISQLARKIMKQIKEG